MVTPDLLAAMRRAGLVHVNFGVESGDDEILRAIKKGIKTDHVVRALEWAKDDGLSTACNFMLGFPQETPEALERTLRFMERIAPLVDTFSTLGVLVPFPGTPIYEDYHEQYGFTDWWLATEYSRYSPAPPLEDVERFYRHYIDDANLELDFFRYSHEMRELIRECMRFKAEHNLAAWGSCPIPPSDGVGRTMIGWDDPATAGSTSTSAGGTPATGGRTTALVAQAALGPGMRVLDVAAGTGRTAAAVLPLLGPAARSSASSRPRAMRSAGMRRDSGPRGSRGGRTCRRDRRFSTACCAARRSGSSIRSTRRLRGSRRSLRPGGALAFDDPGPLPRRAGRAGRRPRSAAARVRRAARPRHGLTARGSGMAARRGERRGGARGRGSRAPCVGLPAPAGTGRPCAVAHDSRADGRASSGSRRRAAEPADRGSARARGRELLPVGALERVDRLEALSDPSLRQLEEPLCPDTDPAVLEARVREDGFLHLRGAFPPERVQGLRNLVLDHARLLGWLDPSAPLGEARGQPGRRIGDCMEPDWLALQTKAQTSEELWDLGDAPAIHKALEAAFGRPSFLYLGFNSCRVTFPHPDFVTQPHQDAHYIRTGDLFVTVWVPLGDCPLELGPLAVLPGSHRRGLLPHRGAGIFEGGCDVEEDAVWRTSAFGIGDAVVLLPTTIHRSFPNRSGHTVRLSADLRYGFQRADAS